MKTERVVVLCLCAVLLSNLYAQCMAWTCHLAMPSLARYVWPIAADSQACNGKDARKLLAPANSLAAFLSAGWPPVGFLYGEARFVMQKYKELHAGHIPPEGIQVVTMRDSHISR